MVNPCRRLYFLRNRQVLFNNEMAKEDDSELDYYSVAEDNDMVTKALTNTSPWMRILLDCDERNVVF